MSQVYLTEMAAHSDRCARTQAQPPRPSLIHLSYAPRIDSRVEIVLNASMTAFELHEDVVWTAGRYGTGSNSGYEFGCGREARYVHFSV